MDKTTTILKWFIAKSIKLQNGFWKDVTNNYASIKQNDIESETQFINTSLLNFIQPKSIELFKLV